ncbi:MEDS domain-containing protein [Domibacillus epiphyticus]|uniref:3-ketoacyl-ACP reductase n=1 Tax=Domibacillus epiphyticus TaxID=1714355 RepID=A0A1V2A7I3_9BACI|nr:MEDS domain-containing protein [Domibacillus epiphyticus]OMP66907.1 3-ketoacyl-ACP reductase [Domibacillus epiphyticus]
MKESFFHLKNENNSAHIFYKFSEEENYIQNVTSYIVDGIEQGEHILFIENDRLFLLIYKRLEATLKPDQLTKIQHINNFNYYFSNGSFHPPTIFNYLSKILESYSENNIPFRIWAHVEWGEKYEVLNIIKEFENEADIAVNELQLMLVCAYDAERIPDSLEEALMKCHEHIMTNDEILPSNLYINKKI